MRKIILAIKWMITGFLIVGGTTLCNQFPTTANQKIFMQAEETGKTIAAFNQQEQTEKEEKDKEDQMTAITITIHEQEFSAYLNNSEASQSLISQMPLSLTMNELNGNEKYIYLDDRLPTLSTVQERIEAGDLMLFGNNCLVLFYESLKSSYSYTVLGKIENPTGLKEAVGHGEVFVVWQVRENETK